MLSKRMPVRFAHISAHAAPNRSQVPTQPQRPKRRTSDTTRRRIHWGRRQRNQTQQVFCSIRWNRPDPETQTLSTMKRPTSASWIPRPNHSSAQSLGCRPLTRRLPLQNQRLLLPEPKRLPRKALFPVRATISLLASCSPVRQLLRRAPFRRILPIPRSAPCKRRTLLDNSNSNSNNSNSNSNSN
eukprot:33677_4